METTEWLNPYIDTRTYKLRPARRQIGFLYRRFYRYASNPTFLGIYLSYVCPHLEYAAAVWDPHQRGLVNTLECVQKFALKASTIGTGMLIMTLIRTCFGRAVSAP